MPDVRALGIPGQMSMAKRDMELEKMKNDWAVVYDFMMQEQACNRIQREREMYAEKEKRDALDPKVRYKMKEWTPPVDL